MKYTEYKKTLEKELKRVEEELKTVGLEDPQAKGEWKAQPDALDIDAADENEIADKFESLEENEAILEQLEIQRNAITHALKKIEEGSYGMCEECGKPIEEERLKANPAAATCTAHMK